MDKAFALLQTKFYPQVIDFEFVARPEYLTRLDERRQRPLLKVEYLEGRETGGALQT